jgi:uncharacterized protein YciI
MRYFAAFLRMKDKSKNAAVRPQHIAFLEDQESKGRIFARGRFLDDAGGLVIYQADSLEEASKIVGQDPYVLQGVREPEIHEWEMTQKR